MPRFWNKVPTFLRSSRLKRLSHLLVQTKSTRLIILSRATLRQNLIFKWLLKVCLENMSLSLWAARTIRNSWRTVLYMFVKIVDGGLHFYFLFSLYFIFIFIFFYFLFLEQLGLEFISHTVTSWWWSHKTDHEMWENGVEDSGIKWYHNNMDNTCWPHVIHMVI